MDKVVPASAIGISYGAGPSIVSEVSAPSVCSGGEEVDDSEDCVGVAASLLVQPDKIKRAHNIMLIRHMSIIFFIFNS
jgi:hypothetical protein